MQNKLSLNNISIRTHLIPGDLGYITWLHGCYYKKEYGYGTEFEVLVAQGLLEFYHSYDSSDSKVWICGHNDQVIGCLFLLSRGEAAQLRFFFLLPPYRSIGLGTKLMELYMAFLKDRGFASSYLWTTSDLHAAAHLYKKYGFTLTAEKPSAAFGKDVTEQRYDLNVI